MTSIANPTSASGDDTQRNLLGTAEAIVTAAMAVWVLVIGKTTEQWWTHVVESLPVWLMVFCPRRPWVRAMMALVAFAWIFMLVAMTPEFRDSIHHWDPGRLKSWLAPCMVVLSLACIFLNASLLRKKPLKWVPFLVVGVLLVLGFYGVNFLFMDRLLEPLQKVVSGQYVWAAAIAIPSFLSAGAGLAAIKGWTRHPGLKISLGTIVWLAAFWGFFVGTMIISQLPGIKIY